MIEHIEYSNSVFLRKHRPFPLPPAPCRGIEDLKNLKPIDISFKILEKAYKLLMKFGFEPKTKARSGNPANEILAEADEGKYELIIMGQYGFSKSNRSALGRVASNVVSNSKVPVLIVK